MPQPKRRGLAPQEVELVNSILETTNLDCLDGASQQLFLSIKSQFAQLSKLSNTQLNLLEKLHKQATRGVYGTAESDSINAKLNAVFNPMKNGRKD
jgi:hypothetical protein